MLVSRALLPWVLIPSLATLVACYSVDTTPFTNFDAAIDSGGSPDAGPDAPVEEPAVLTTTQADHDFGDVTEGQTSGLLGVAIRNSGGEASSAITVALAGVDAAHFEIVPTGDDTDCAGATLEPDATCTAQVRFAPEAAGDRSADLEVSATDGGVVTVELDGNGLSPGDLEITAGGTLAFGTIEIQSMSTTQTVTVRNNGGSPTATLTTVLGDTTNYTITSDGCAGSPLAAGASCNVAVRFGPTIVGSLPAQVSVRESPTTGVSASATGTGSARIQVNKTGTGTITSTPAGISCAGGCSTSTVSFTQTPVTLTAAEGAGHAFDGWTGACASANPSPTCQLALTSPLTTTGAVFRAWECTPDAIVCNDATDVYTECSPTGLVEFEMACPLGCADGVEKCLDVNPSNGLASYLDMAPDGPDLDFTAATSTINTDTGAVLNGGTTVAVPSAVVNGVRVFWMKSLDLAGIVTVSGSNPLAILVDGDLNITGTLDLSADSLTAGPGASTGTCVGETKISPAPVPGGGGGGGANTGRNGGASSAAAGGAGGAAQTNVNMVPLTGGCAGGLSRGTSGSAAASGWGGAGGGAVQLVSRTTILVSGSGKIDASGGGGTGGYQLVVGPSGGGGGGAGGGILLEANQIVLDGSSVVLSTKGGGGGGVGQSANGADGGTEAAVASGGDSPNGDYPIGGTGGTGVGTIFTTLPGVGGNSNAAADSGAGGGGSVGRVRLNTTAGTVNPQNGAAIRSYATHGNVATRLVP